MATIKSYTDLEQSKKLAEILPLESADMHWSKDFDGSWFADLSEYKSVKIPKYVGNVEKHLLPCWSLTALLGVLPMIRKDEDTANPFIAKTPDGEYYIVYATLTKEVYSSSTYDNSVDACVAMIEKLHELNLL